MKFIHYLKFYNHKMLLAILLTLMFMGTLSSPILSSPLARQLRFVNVKLIVKDFDGNPVRNAEVRAFSEDWGISYPDYFGYTDENGAYNFEIPMGNWSFFIGKGWESSRLHLGEGLFLVLPYIQIMKDTTLIAQPNDRITIEIYDVNGRPLDVTVRIMDNKHVPIIVTPIAGITREGKITIHVINGLTYDMLFFAHSSDVGYIGLRRNIPSGSRMIIRLTSSDLSHIVFETYDQYSRPTKAIACINYHRFDVGINTGLAPVCFNFNGLYRVYATPDLVGVSVNLNTDNWFYHFAVNDYYLEPGKDFILRYGGPFSVKVKVLQQNSQIWLHVKDAYGNTLIYCNDDKGDFSVPVKLRKDGKIIFEGDMAKIVGRINALIAGRIGQTFEIGDSPEYEIILNLGPFGEFYLNGTLLSKETLLRYDKITTEHFTIYFPEGLDGKFNKMASLFEAAYSAISEAINENLTRPIEVTFYINPGVAGFGGRNHIDMGLGFSIDSSLETVPSTFLSVAFHELGHVFQLSPPLHDYFIVAWFGEPFATLLGHEAIKQILGPQFDLHQQGWHNAHFFEYLKTRKEINLIENIQFVLFYLRKNYGMEIHKNFVHLWANQTFSNIKNKLINAGFNREEIIVILYSYLAKENLAWLFKLAGLEISEKRVNQGLEILSTKTETIISYVTVTKTISIPLTIISPSTVTKTFTTAGPTITETKITTATVLVTSIIIEHHQPWEPNIAILLTIVTLPLIMLLLHLLLRRRC